MLPATKNDSVSHPDRSDHIASIPPNVPVEMNRERNDNGAGPKCSAANLNGAPGP